MRIILTGASGVGKTTILEKFNLPKIQEVARTLMREKGIKLNEDGDTRTQELIWNEYEKKLSSKNSYISDRGLVDVISYTKAKLILTENEKNEEYETLNLLYKYQLSHLHQFVIDNPDIIYVYVPIEFDMEDDGVRSKNEEYRNLTAKLMRDLMDELGLKYITVHGSVDERVEQINNFING